MVEVIWQQLCWTLVWPSWLEMLALFGYISVRLPSEALCFNSVCPLVAVQVGSPLEEPAKSSSSPLLIVTGSRGSIKQTYLLIEGQATDVPSLLSAIDKASKLHYICHVAYRDAAEHVWQFIQKVVYDTQDDSSTYGWVRDFVTYMKGNKGTPGSKGKGQGKRRRAE